MLKNIAIAAGLVTCAYYIMGRGYDLGVHEALQKMMAYAKEHEDETFGEFFLKIET